ncbi:hypothetical protein [Pleomorphovibrio marinus]|uniref:hypothetical protein n=1 Tax=Pleomorphovibrio marinus TaxID=2164132 RepID=UPI001E3ADA95|nr:hypothetical protein [Pleomorphovibrio marinus]
MDTQEWHNYWYQGQAEISTFDLLQYRYGEEREGEAVMIFVTEDFSRKKQVKLDDPEQAGRDAEKVLKLNFTKEFKTGIYPYHMMLSVFSPVYANTSAMKITASSQEWCGQSFTQMNLSGGDRYKVKLFSYFEEEGDEEFSITAMAEDHLWNLIRFGPEHLPTGEINLIPGLLEQRFSHIQPAPQKALIRINRVDSTYDELEVDYVEYNRTLKVHFEKSFPHQIIYFEEIHENEDGNQEVTTGERKAIRQIDYWNRNKKSDTRYRRELQLSP